MLDFCALYRLNILFIAFVGHICIIIDAPVDDIWFVVLIGAKLIPKLLKRLKHLQRKDSYQP